MPGQSMCDLWYKMWPGAGFPLSIIPPILHTHFWLICHRCYVMLATDSVVILRHFLLRIRTALCSTWPEQTSTLTPPHTPNCVPTSADASCTTWQWLFNKELFLNRFMNTRKFRPFRQLIYRRAQIGGSQLRWFVINGAPKLTPLSPKVWHVKDVTELFRL